MAACSSTVAGSRAELIRVNVPVAQAEHLVSEAENFTLAIVTADRDRIDPEQPGFKGPTPSGECRVYMNRRTPVSSDNLYELAFSHLDKVVVQAGGIDEIMKTPEKIPTVNIWGDSTAPWRCFANVIHDVQLAGYPGVDFIVTPHKVERRDPTAIVAHTVYFDLPLPDDQDYQTGPVPNADGIAVTAAGSVFLNGEMVTLAGLQTSLKQRVSSAAQPNVRFEAEAGTRYEFIVNVLNVMRQSGVTVLSVDGVERSRNF